ncbi:MAG: ATP-dependent DNA helicase, partial [Caulobacteraceae bacterium]
MEASPADAETVDAAPAPPPPAALVVLPGPKAAAADNDGARFVEAAMARRLFHDGALVAHASLTARRLNLAPPPRSPGLYDALELFAFVRPAQFAAPSAAGLARAVGLAEPKGAAGQASALRDVAATLLAELAA